MEPAGSVTRWLEGAKGGDQLALALIWERYSARLIALARKKLRGVARREADEEDIAISAFDSLYRGIRAGRFRRLADRQDLWQLLVLIAARKASDQRMRQKRQKRGSGRVRGDSVFIDQTDANRWRTINEIVGREPTPEFAASVAEQFSLLLKKLQSPVLSQVAIWKMEGHTNREIAEKLGCQIRTVERKVRLIREALTEER